MPNNAHTIIDPYTDLFENKQASWINPFEIDSVHVLDDDWLSQYPKPVQIIYDQGTKHQNTNFKSHFMNLGTEPFHTIYKTPQSNAIIEQVMI